MKLFPCTFGRRYAELLTKLAFASKDSFTRIGLRESNLVLFVRKEIVPFKGRVKIIGTGPHLRKAYSRLPHFRRFWLLTRGHARHLTTLCKSKAPFRILVFDWFALLGCILTIDNLRRQNMIIIGACPLCLAAEESVDHVLLHYPLAHKVRSSTISCFELSWVLPRGIGELYEA